MIAIISSIYLTGFVVFFSIVLKEVVEEEQLGLRTGLVLGSLYLALLWFIRLPLWLFTQSD